MNQEIHNFMIHEKIKHDKTYHNIHRSCWISLLSFKTTSTFCKIPCLDNTKPLQPAKFPVISEESPSFLAARWELDGIDWCEFSVQSFFLIFWNLLQLWPKSTKTQRHTGRCSILTSFERCLTSLPDLHWIWQAEQMQDSRRRSFPLFHCSLLVGGGKVRKPDFNTKQEVKSPLPSWTDSKTIKQRYQLPFDLKTISQTYINEKRYCKHKNLLPQQTLLHPHMTVYTTLV